MSAKRKEIRDKKMGGKRPIDEKLSFEGECPVWMFDMLDRAGPFAFDPTRRDFDAREFIEKMIAYSNMTWGDIRKQTHDMGKSKHHYLDESGMSDGARERIVAKNLQEQSDSLYSFAFRNKLRIIGIRDGKEFHVIWYDTEHKFYPSRK